jgi:uncharacterized iron-regulated membrane protein
MNPTSSTLAPNASALYRAVWRWHFYAGLVVAPFAMFLSVTGSIYLWKPQFEARRYHDFLFVAPAATHVSAEAQLAAAHATHPDATPVTFTPAFAPDRTSETVLRLKNGDKVSVFVDPANARVTGEIREADRFMRIVHDLHGTLLAGRAGEYVVELVASWALVLFLTGLYLWWPRPRFTVWGFLLPRLRAEGRTFWRDLHAVPAVWLSAATLFLLSTGLLWTKAAGAWYRTLSAAVGEGTPHESNASAHRSELTGWSPPLMAGLAAKVDQLASSPAPTTDDPHAEHRHRGHDDAEKSARDEKLPSSIPLDRVIALAAEHRIAQPYAIAFPVGPAGVFSAITDRNFALQRSYLHLDRYSGKVLAELRYGDFGLLAKFSLWAIIAHEGQLFGLLNQILGTLAAAGVFLLAASGLIMWWQRRPAGKLAAPMSDAALPRPVFLGTLALALFLPLLAATFLVALLGERWLRRAR